MIHTTTSTLQGKEITEYLGIVTGEVMMTDNKIKQDWVASAHEGALQEMNEAAKKLGADAVVGVGLQYPITGMEVSLGGAILIVSACGTAVKVK